MLWHSQDLRRVETAANIALVIALANEGDDTEKADEADRAIEVFRHAMRTRASKVEAWKEFCGSRGLPAEMPASLGGDTAPPMGLTEDMALEIGECEPDAGLVFREKGAI